MNQVLLLPKRKSSAKIFVQKDWIGGQKREAIKWMYARLKFQFVYFNTRIDQKK